MEGPARYSGISVVVCTYNRQKFIGKALECLGEQTLPPDQFEILIIDNNSTDQTAGISRDFIQRHPRLNAHYFLETQKGLSFARNRGLQEASFPIITYIDDDAEAVPVFLETILLFMQSHPGAVGVGGKIIPKYSESEEPAWMSKYLNGFVGRLDYGGKARQFQQPAMKYPAGCNMTYTASVLKEVGGFNNQLTFRSDDKHIYYVVSKVSPEVYYVPEATVYHNIDKARLQLDSFRKLFLKTGNEEKIRVRLEEGRMGWWKKLVEFTVKLGASLLIYMLYVLKGQGIKGKYVFLSQWYTLMGFIKADVFVR
jgi:glycosyltransferase involved in cell wall biosynthesis